MLLSHTELLSLVRSGIIENAAEDQVNAASIDLTLGDSIMIEDEPRWDSCIDLSRKGEGPKMRAVDIAADGYHLSPGQFVLAQTREKFHLPNDISGEFKLRSSIARAGLNHLLAGWCDAGWHDSVLTLELHNVLKRHALCIRPGMRIGQMIFYRHAPVPENASYAVRGRYNGDDTVTASRGVEYD